MTFRRRLFERFCEFWGFPFEHSELVEETELEKDYRQPPGERDETHTYDVSKHAEQ